MLRKLNQDEIGRVWFRRSRRFFEPGPRPQMELVVFLGIAGRMSYFVEGELVQLGPQELMVVESGLSHFLVSESESFDMVVFVLSPEALVQSELVQPWENCSDQSSFVPRTIPFDQAKQLQELGTLLTGDTRRAVLRAGMGWWLHIAAEAWGSAQDRTASRLHPAVAIALRAINDDPAISIEEVARIANVTASRLGQVFKHQIGQTMQSYRAEKRFEHLEKMMSLNPEQQLLPAAFDVGFGDYSSFYRAFKKHYGCTPRSYFK